MKIAYVFKTDMSSTFQLSTMILPQLDEVLLKEVLSNVVVERLNQKEWLMVLMLVVFHSFIKH